MALVDRPRRANGREDAGCPTRNEDAQRRAQQNPLLLLKILIAFAAPLQLRFA